MSDLVTRSIAIIEAGQAPSGAYVACPTFPAYRYCWFRDGTFIAHAMDLWHKHESAGCFYNWAVQNIRARASIVEHCLAMVAQGLAPNPAELLDTRYTLDGQATPAGWPNFQLDGFGTLLWGLQRHLWLTSQKELPADWSQATSVLIHYLHTLWKFPNYDCWEEFPDNIAVSTLATLYAGLHAIASVPGLDEQAAQLAAKTATDIKTFALTSGVHAGHLIKQIAGADVIDANLLWASVPFEEHGLLQPTDGLMQATAEKIEADLLGGTGGVHRNRADTFYGGGEWILLTALLGEYRLAVGDRSGAQSCLHFIEQSANEQGELPEQISDKALDPTQIAEWIEGWGSVAQPLLWSHASYLSLYAQLQL